MTEHEQLLHTLGAKTHEDAMAEIGRLHGEISALDRLRAAATMVVDRHDNGSLSSIKGDSLAIENLRLCATPNVEHDRRTAGSSPGVRVDGPVGPHTQER